MYSLSICIPTLGRASQLNELLACIAGQWYALSAEQQGLVELCVSDNCSVDETPAVLERWSPRLPRLKVTRQSARIGFPENLAAALAPADGTFVWLMGDDDLLMPGALAKILGLLASPEYADSRLVLINEAEFDRGTGQFVAQHDRTVSKAYTAASTILEECRLEGLGHISRLILRRDVLSTELYAARQAWDLMPFLRWVVAAMAEGRHHNIGETLIIAHYVADNPHWRGRWMYCYACELPELITQIRRTCTLSPRADRGLLPVKKYLKGYFQLSLLRDGHEQGWAFARALRPQESGPRLAAQGIDFLWGARWTRRLGIRLVRRAKPSFGLSA